MNINEMFPSRYLSSAALEGKEHTVTVESVTMEPMEDDKELPVLRFKGRQAALVLNKTNGTFMASLFGDESDNWAGKEIILRVEKVNLRGSMVDGIRLGVVPTESKAASAKGPAFVDEDNDVPF